MSASIRCEQEFEVTSSDGNEVALSEEQALASVDLVFACNIARPGAIAIVGGAVFAANRFYHSVAMELPDTLAMARDTALSLGWPHIRALDLAETWTWLQRQIGFTDSFGGGPTGRALNALSHIYSDSRDSAVDLMWAMIGLEAMFTSGNTGLVQQLRERGRCFLSDSPAASRLISKMYDLRSRFVHGDLDFIGAFSIYDADPRVEEHRKAVGDATDLGVAMLLATVQELIVRDWDGVNFATVCTAV